MLRKKTKKDTHLLHYLYYRILKLEETTHQQESFSFYPLFTHFYFKFYVVVQNTPFILPPRIEINHLK